MRLLPCGDAAILVELELLDAVLAWSRALESERSAGGFPEVIDVVPAAVTVLVRCRPGTAMRSLAGRLRALAPQPPSPTAGALIEVPVHYDGPDLTEVAELAGLSTDEVVRLHTAAEWTVAFTGFAPGFGYLVGGDPRLQVPRRVEPRTRVPAGAVGLAGAFTGVYPRTSPGGWQLIGRTDVELWRADRDPPALLVPGTRVRFSEANR